MARVEVHYPYLGEEDPVWDAPAIRFYGSFCFLSGVVAALIGTCWLFVNDCSCRTSLPVFSYYQSLVSSSSFSKQTGIGGGMVLGPLMLIMGVDPRVSNYLDQFHHDCHYQQQHCRHVCDLRIGPVELRPLLLLCDLCGSLVGQAQD